MTTHKKRTKTDASTRTAKTCSVRLIVPHANGLHARPAALPVKTAQAFDSESRMECDGHCANAKSILRIMALGAQQGADVTITAKGHGADAALHAIECAFICFDHEWEPAAGLECCRATARPDSTGWLQAATADTHVWARDTDHGREVLE